MHLDTVKTEQCPSATMTIDLNAIEHNLIQCRKYLQPSTRLMVVLKAHAYGTRVEQTTRWLESTGKVDYIAVAFIDEGVEMRRVGIHLPIMVMNVDSSAFELCQRYELEPVIYSLSFLERLVQWINASKISSFPSLHIKLNTGMNRMGIDIGELSQLLVSLSNSHYPLRIRSVYSHLAASEDPNQDQFTAEQAKLFLAGVQFLQENLDYSFLKHLCNSFGVLRHPHLHFDMVRIGGAVFGGGCFPASFNLQPAISLSTSISQVRRVKEGETMGYNRRGLATRDSLIGIIRIGYADGVRRQMGNGHACVWIRNRRVPIVRGSVCMDMVIIDLTDVPVEKDTDLENEPVEIFGKHIDIQEVAQWSDTIAFDIISSINQRVQRVYVGNGIA